MKLKDYIEGLTDLVDQNPEYAELTVISASDSEGNHFDKVQFEPTLGAFDDESFTQEENFEDLDEEERVINAVCIN